MKRKRLFLLIWLIIIVLGSLTPSNNIPKLNFFPHFDKIVHFGLYFVLTILLIPQKLKKTKYLKNYAIAFIISCNTGILFELLQLYMTKSRSGTIYDAIANTIGATVGILFYQLFIREKWIEKIIFKIQ